MPTHNQTYGPAAIYLRKSRADVEAEARGEGETLARHERTLLDLAARMGIAVAPDHIYRELVSGDSIADRPVMTQLLREVEAGLWSNVLVVDIDRLARGETIDQGIMAQAFKYSGTQIITPYKTYDPASDTDETFMEFGLFMARQEYRMIKRRMQAGRIASVKEGHYIGTRMPFGYVRAIHPTTKGPTLAIDPDKAAIVRQVYAMYINGNSSNAITTWLNDMGVRTALGNLWEPDRVRNMLQNPTYIGKVQWNQRQTVIEIQNGQRVTSRPKSANYVCYDGLHEPIIDMPTWDRVRALFSGHKTPPLNTKRTMENPLSGLVECGVCGRTLVRRKHERGDSFRCTTPHCPIVVTYIRVVEDGILEVLKLWTKEYAKPPSKQSSKQRTEAEALAAVRKETLSTIKILTEQKTKLHDLLERGIYSDEIFFQRNNDLSERLRAAESTLQSLTTPPLPEANIRALLPQIRTVLAAYKHAKTPQQKNALLKSVIARVIYNKSIRCYRNQNPAEHVELTITPIQHAE